MDSSARLLKILQAPADVQERIDRILRGDVQNDVNRNTGPLLMGMSAGAQFLGVSRTTLWRLIKDGRLPRLEIRPGSYRLRKSDIEKLANGGAIND